MGSIFITYLSKTGNFQLLLLEYPTEIISFILKGNKERCRIVLVSLFTNLSIRSVEGSYIPIV